MAQRSMQFPEIFPGPSLLFRISRSAHLIRSVLEKSLRESKFDLTPEEAMAIALISHSRASTISELAKALLRDRTTVTRLIDSLESKGFVQREVGSSDRRSVKVNMTAAGKELDRKLGINGIKVLSSLLKGVSLRDLNTAARVLDRLQEQALLILDEDVTPETAP